MTPAELLAGPDPVVAWLRLDCAMRTVIGRRMTDGPTPKADQALDKQAAILPSGWDILL